MAKKIVTFYKINDADLSHLATKEGQLIITEDAQRAYLDITDEDRIELENYDLDFNSSDRYKLVFKYPDGTTKTLFITGIVRNLSTGVTNGTVLMDRDGVLTEVSVAGLKALAFKDTISADEVTSGILPVSRGGTGKGTFIPDQVLIGAGTSAIAQKAIDTTAGGTDNSNDLISSGAVKAGLDTKIPLSQKGAANGVASLDGTGKVPAAQLPAFVDDVLEFATRSDFPAIGESGKIYVALDTNLTYRWSGSAYVEISPSLALGETSTTAYRGDRGKIAYDHAAAKGNAYASNLYQITTNAEGHVTAAAAMTQNDFITKYDIKPTLVVTLAYDGTSSKTGNQIMSAVLNGYDVIAKWEKAANNYIYVPLIKGDISAVFGITMPVGAPTLASGQMRSVTLTVADAAATYTKVEQMHNEEASSITISALNTANNTFTIAAQDSEGHTLTNVADIEALAQNKMLYLTYSLKDVSTNTSKSFIIPYSFGDNTTTTDTVLFSTIGNLSISDEVSTGIYHYKFTLNGTGNNWNSGTITRTQLNAHDVVNVQNYSTTNSYSCNYVEEHFQPTVLYGFVEPTNGQGVDGDIYLLLDDTPI